MRFRPLVVLSAAALSAVLLAGCSGSSDPEATPTETSAAGDLCAAAAPSGAASDSVEVEGEAGAPSTVTFSTPLEIPELERTVLVEGDGDAIAAGDYVSYALSAFSAETGELLGEVGYNEGEILPSAVSPDAPLGQILGCATVGTRIVATFPASEQAGAEVYVVDVTGISPTAAWGEPQAPVDGMPVVELAADGQPSVTIPDAAPPADLQLEVLKKGDGAVVEAGDSTLLQYYGVDWETGESFDSSWANGAPYANQGNQYVEGFVQALVGQTVGSQVVVVIPPALGYGEAGASDHELAGKTLVFVIDILATQHAIAQ